MMATKARRSPAAALTNLRDRVRTDGVEAAYEALVAVCRDPKAPAQARATASTTLFRAGGMLERFEDDLDDLEPGEMTWDQLQRTIVRGAREAGAPEELVDAVEQASDAAPTTAPRPRRAAGKPAAAEAGSGDEGGAAAPQAWLGDFG